MSLSFDPQHVNLTAIADPAEINCYLARLTGNDGKDNNFAWQIATICTTFALPFGACLLPMLFKADRFAKVRNIIFVIHFLGRYVGTGVILSTAFC